MSLFAEILGALARWALTLLSGYLVTHHVLTATQGDHLTTELVAHLVLAAPAIAAIAWSVWAKTRHRWQL